MWSIKLTEEHKRISEWKKMYKMFGVGKTKNKNIIYTNYEFNIFSLKFQ